MRAEYIASRDVVAALTGEDSSAFVLAQQQQQQQQQQQPNAQVAGVRGNADPAQ